MPESHSSRTPTAQVHATLRSTANRALNLAALAAFFPGERPRLEARSEEVMRMYLEGCRRWGVDSALYLPPKPADIFTQGV